MAFPVNHSLGNDQENGKTKYYQEESGDSEKNYEVPIVTF